MKRIVVCNDGVDSANKGDQAILRSILPVLAKRYPRASIQTFSYSGTRSPGKILGLVRALVRCDAFILGGGHPFQDLTSQAFLLFGLFLIGVAKGLGKKVFCLGVGAGPVASFLGRILTGPVVGLADGIGVRDRASLGLLETLGVRSDRMELTADWAFLLPSPGRQRASEILELEGIPRDGSPAVGICLRRWFHFRHRFFPRSRGRFSPGERRRMEDADGVLVRFCDSLTKNPGARLVFIPMRKAGAAGVPGQDDDLYSEEIRGRLENPARAFVIRGDYPPEDLKALLGAMDAVVAMRMHALILAASSGVPVMGISITPAKGPGLFDVLGLRWGYLPVEKLAFDPLRERFSVLWRQRVEIGDLFRGRLETWEKRALNNLEILERFS
jgi:polysaccharide pyruvyl transferase WcaK-like protein